MPTIDIRRSHALGREGARAATEKVAEKLRDKIQVETRWVGDDLVFERAGAKGKIAVGETEVRVEIDLGLMLRPMKGTVEQKVQKYLDEALRAGPS